MNKDNCVGFGVGLLTGAVIGGVIALLFAPKSGKETRQLLKDKAMETRDNVKDFAGETVEKVREGASEANRKGQAAMHALKN
jgi:gas vesicle protein